MGENCDPGTNLQHASWMYDSLSQPSNHRPPDIGQWNMNPMVFPVYSNPYGCAITGNGSMPFAGFPAHGVRSLRSASLPQLNPINVQLGLAVAEKGFLAFNYSGDQTNLIFSSVRAPFQNPNISSVGLDMLGGNETNVLHARESAEMHEDTEEIDALLYSDSYEHYEEEEASTGHSPFEAIGSTEEVASSFVPAKRRRLNKELDASFTDTASSALVHNSESHLHSNLDNGDESSFVKGGDIRAVGGERDLTATNNMPGSKHAMRERIRETVSILRRIIPGGKGKDAATVLDEAIQYLRSLKLKAKAMGATHL